MCSSRAISHKEEFPSPIGPSSLHGDLGFSLQSQRLDEMRKSASKCHASLEGGFMQGEEPLLRMADETRVEYHATKDSYFEEGINAEARNIFLNSYTPDESSSNSPAKNPSRVNGALQANDGRFLSEFALPVDKATLDRFHKIATPICISLKEYVKTTPIERLTGKLQSRKSQFQDRTMAVRLMVLGETESEAKPYIVVLSAENLSRRVRKFFKKKTVQSLIKPPDEAWPAFEYLIYERPPDLKQAEDEDICVLAPVEDDGSGRFTGTFCGTPIIIRHSSCSEARATLGGIIKVVNDSGLTELYGLTAGHAMGELGENSQFSPMRSPSTGCNYLVSDSDLESGSDSETSYPINAATTLSESSQSIEARIDSSAWWPCELGKIGAISRHSPQVCWGSAGAMVTVPRYDWALIEMLTYKPNQLSPPSRQPGTNIRTLSVLADDLVMPTSIYQSAQIPVAVISGSGGLKRGSLSPLPAKFTLGSSGEFVDAMIVNLDNGKDILDGDSGSWVVNETTLEVLGHVVAADTLGGAYIMPLNGTLSEIKSHLRAKSVELASSIDIESSLTKDHKKTTVISHPEHPRNFRQHTETLLPSPQAHIKQEEADRGRESRSNCRMERILQDVLDAPTEIKCLSAGNVIPSTRDNAHPQSTDAIPESNSRTPDAHIRDNIRQSKKPPHNSAHDNLAPAIGTPALVKTKAKFTTFRQKRARSPDLNEDEREDRIPTQRQRSSTKTMDPQLPKLAPIMSGSNGSMSKPLSTTWSSATATSAAATAAAPITLEKLKLQAKFATSRQKRVRSPSLNEDERDDRIPKQRRRSFTKTMDPAVLSFYGEKPVPLPSRFGHLKRRLVAGHESALEASWGRLLTALRQEIDHIETKGTDLIPSIDFGDITSATKVRSFSDKVKRYGIGVVRGVVANSDTGAWVEETKKYLETKHEFKPPPAQDPTCFDFFWSPCQVRSRAHPNVLSVQRFAMSIWETTDDDRLATRFPICYADRIRIDINTISHLNVGSGPSGEESLPPASSTLIAQVDNGSLERWEVDGYGHSGCYDAIWRGDWEEYNPWDPTGRINATTDLYNGAGACSMFRMFQGVLALTTVEPGMVRLLPSPKLSTAYFLLRPFFKSKSAAPKNHGDIRAWEAYMDASNWQLERNQTTIIHGAVPGHAQRVTDTWHPHLRLKASLVAPPILNPGDYIIWHPDQPYAFEQPPSSLSMLVYIPAAPLTQTNALFLARQRKAFLRGHPGPDFDSTGSGLGSEAQHTGRLDEKDIADAGGQEALQAMGLAPWILDKSMVEDSKMGTPAESRSGTPTGEIKPILLNVDLNDNETKAKMSGTEADIARIANMVLFPERFDFWLPSRVATPSLEGGKSKEIALKET